MTRVNTSRRPVEALRVGAGRGRRRPGGPAPSISGIQVGAVGLGEPPPVVGVELVHDRSRQRPRPSRRRAGSWRTGRPRSPRRRSRLAGWMASVGIFSGGADTRRRGRARGAGSAAPSAPSAGPARTGPLRRHRPGARPRQAPLAHRAGAVLAGPPPPVVPRGTDPQARLVSAARGRADPMLFPTAQFGIFFIVVFLVSWRLRPNRRGVDGLHARGQLRVLRLVGLAVRVPSSPPRPGSARSWARPSSARRRPPQAPHAASPSAGNLVVLGFLGTTSSSSSASPTAWPSSGWGPDPLLLRIILPIGISFFTFQAIQLRGGHLPPRPQASPPPIRVRACRSSPPGGGSRSCGPAGSSPSCAGAPTSTASRRRGLLP